MPSSWGGRWLGLGLRTTTSTKNPRTAIVSTTGLEKVTNKLDQSGSSAFTLRGLVGVLTQLAAPDQFDVGGWLGLGLSNTLQSFQFKRPGPGPIQFFAF